MARKKKQTRDELEELDEVYVGLAGTTKQGRGCGIISSLLLILLLLGGIALVVYMIKYGALIG